MTFIKAKKIKDSVIKRNIVYGKADLLEAEEVNGSDVSNNIHIIPNKKPVKRWYEKPVGIIMLAIIAILIAATITYYFGLT